MKNLLLLSSMLFCFAASCLSCSTLKQVGTFEKTNDVNAIHVQELSRQAVYLKIDAVIQVEDENELVEVKIMRANASGTVVKEVVVDGKEKTIILSVAHACEPASSLTEDKVLSVSIEIRAMTIDGVEKAADVSFVDRKNDICTLVVNGKIGNVAKLADEEPPFGAIVEHIGADAGVFAKKVAIYTSGRFTGIINEEDFDRTVNSIIAYYGASGSGLLYNGKLYSLISVTRTPPTSYIVLGPRLKDIKAAIDNTVRSILK
jgi:hypothetical protein